MKALLTDLLALRRGQPGHDLLSVVATSGLPLSDDELLHNAIFLLSAGHDTTTAVLTGAVTLLIDQPAQRRLLADPVAAPHAADELVRRVSPAQLISRVAGAPIEISGKVIEPGAPILLGLAAANRDPAVFADPDRLDLTRSTTGHLGCGFGPHVCLGAPLARMQVRLGLTALFDRFPGLAPLAEARREPSAVLTSYRSYRLADRG